MISKYKKVIKDFYITLKNNKGLVSFTKKTKKQYDEFSKFIKSKKPKLQIKPIKLPIKHLSLFKKPLKFLIKHRVFLYILIILVTSGILHGYNMFNYPYYESDEGTYTSQAWSIINEGKLSPYTYWYDHPPMGWALLAGWFSILPDGIFTFGTSIDSGRVLMLIIHLLSTLLIFFITKKITNSNLAALLSCLLFSLSPLGLYFQRRVLLDNILIFWILSSIAILYKSKLTLREYALSGLFYAMAFLTKVTTAMFGPAILFLVIALKDKTHKVFRTTVWLTTSILVTSLYIIFAIIKGELFPSIFKQEEHVSLVGSILFQMERGNTLHFFQQGSDFLLMVKDWTLRDPIFMYLTVVTVLLGAIFSLIKKDLNIRFMTISIVLYTIFLIRGGIVINFYILPIIPFISILFSLALIESIKQLFIWIDKAPDYFIIKKIKMKNFLKKLKVTIFTTSSFVFFIFLFSFIYIIQSDKSYLVKNEAENQRIAIEWIKKTLPAQSDIVIDSVMLVELRDPNYINNKTFDNAEWFYKVSRDPQIRLGKYNDSWKTLDYLAITHEMLKQIDQFEDEDIVHAAYSNSLPIAKWFEGSSSYIDEQKLITTNGDWSMVYAINGNTKSQLVDSWEFYKDNFIFSYGQTIDLSNGITTSEGQSYAMLRAAWMNDKETFNGSWLWTQHHLQHRLDDKLISWKWGNDKLLDSTNATDADLDIAMALLFGSKIFKDDSYLEDAKEIIKDIWEEAVVEVNGTYYLLASNKSQAQVPGGLLFNPSYMSPAHYRMFAQVDPEHDWNKLADDTYKILNRISAQNVTDLPANWYILNTSTGSLDSARAHINNSADYYGYDAFRIIWRVWLDYNWFDSSESNDYLQSVGRYFINRTDGDNKLPTILDPITGIAISWEESIAIHTGYVLALAANEDKTAAINYYENFIASQYNEDGFWGSKDNYYYYDQNWVWFMSAVYNNDVYNLWEAF